MKERPILFSAEMVVAILNGRKTQTRRIYKGKEPVVCVGDVCVTDAKCPYGIPGDWLWIRESCWIDGATNHVHYCATDMQNAPKKTPSIFMPRWASRITLEVIKTRVERLQDISREDIRAEGVGLPVSPRFSPTDGMSELHKEYRDLWNSINGAGSWDINSWVWVVEFKRVIGDEI